MKNIFSISFFNDNHIKHVSWIWRSTQTSEHVRDFLKWFIIQLHISSKTQICFNHWNEHKTCSLIDCGVLSIYYRDIFIYFFSLAITFSSQISGRLLLLFRRARSFCSLSISINCFLARLPGKSDFAKKKLLNCLSAFHRFETKMKIKLILWVPSRSNKSER